MMMPRLFAVLLLVGATSVSTTQAQDKKESRTDQVHRLIMLKRYVLNVQSATPLRGGMKQLTSSYDLTVLEDSVIVYLPYFGRAYTAPIDPADGGIHFTSTDFEYRLTSGRKGGWDISITPKDAKNVQKLNLSIGEDGYGTLQVQSLNRDPISFYGSISEVKKKRKKG